MNIFETVRDIIADQLDVEKDVITPETSFEEDLEADSLDVFQVISEIEDELDIVIETDDNISTVKELVDFIENQEQ
ncbi:MAG: acyl carrier protein [Atopococcus tabaci]|uniref:Acyl carrier protein n=1 Tax=Atopococcus tabaci TaxID=269774 RepID=A0AA43ZRT4_9LACT|nr:acyl carrier protein [Atopococcus tabaci]